MTFFAKMDPKLNPVREDGNIEAVPFLLACRQMLPIIDGFGPAFWTVKNDIDGNIMRVLKRQASDPVRYQTFRDLLQHEIDTEMTRDYESATLSLLWLKRTLEFLVVFLSELVTEYHSKKNSNSLYPACLKAYNKTLRPFHGWLVQKIFPLLARVIPWKRDFIKTLAYGQENLVDEVYKDMDSFTVTLENNTQQLAALFLELELDYPDKV